MYREELSTMNNEDNNMRIYKTIPLRGIGKIIASRMTESLRKSPQASCYVKVDMSSLLSLKEEYKSQGHKVSITEMSIKIAARALEENPLLNASLQDNEIHLYKNKNIGFAAATPDDGLVVPVVKNVQEKSILEVSNEVKGLVSKVNNGSLEMKDCTEGTFTISSLGMYDVDGATPIINMPEAAIIAIGTTRKEPIVDDNDSIVIKPMGTISLTIDHAVINGVPATKFLMTLKQMMESAEQYIK